MTQPEGFVKDHTLVCKLNKSIYGLKQSARNWNLTLISFMETQKLKQSLSDPCVFFRKSEKDTLYALIWVDDLILCKSNMTVLNIFKTHFQNRFKIKDIGCLSWFLGMQFSVCANVISINQTLYVNTILTRFKMTDCNPRNLPCDPTVHQLLKQDSAMLDDQTQFRELIGSLIYLMVGTRPDLAFVVTLLSQFMSAPKVIHMKIALGVLRYLKYTAHYDLKYTKHRDPLQIVGYADSDYAAGKDRQSISGYCFRLNTTSALISWASRKQNLIADSTCESEYIALNEATKEALFLRMLFAELTQSNRQTVVIRDGNHEAIDSVVIYEDNKGAIDLAHHQTFHKRSKHIDIKYHLIRDYVKKKSVHVTYVPTKDNIADMFTKALPGPKLKSFAIIRGTVSNVEGD
ncbi:unnamed protein product, partial [Meganyctiphanes norvegica]